MGAVGIGAAAVAPVVGACSVLSGDDRGDGEPIRFALAPDPVWDAMIAEGTMGAWEADHNLKIQTSSTWDEFSYFAGGHGDIVSTATYELPLLEEQTGIRTVTFGKYNLLRITPMVRADSPYQTLADIPAGSRIAVPSAVSSTLVWGMFAKKLHDLDFRVGGGDFGLIVEDHFVMAEHVDRGEVEAALVIPEAAIGYIRQGKLRALYDERLPWQVFGDICGCEHVGIMGNLFTAREEWFDGHQEEARAFLDLWQQGMRIWQEKQAEIIRDYPQHFQVESDEDIQAIQDFLLEHPWFVDDVHLDQDWIDSELLLYDSMKETGFMDADAPVPRFDALLPA